MRVFKRLVSGVVSVCGQGVPKSVNEKVVQTERLESDGLYWNLVLFPTFDKTGDLPNDGITRLG